MTPEKTYEDLLNRKIVVAEKVGIEISPDELHPSAKPHQRDTVCWALGTGRAGIFLECGLGKSQVQIEILQALHRRHGGNYLIITELGVTQEFCDPIIGEGARLGVSIQYVEDQQQALDSDASIVVTNYERIRLDKFDLSIFDGVCLDEGSYLKNMASDTTEALGRELRKVKYKFVSTATPSPNETLELVNYAHILGVMDRGQALTRFFQRNSQKAGELTVHPNHEADFWLWVHSWSIWLTEPADLGYPNEGYQLPELQVVWHEVNVSGYELGSARDRDGQAKIMADAAASLPEAAQLKKASIADRVERAMEIVNAAPEDHFIIWHHLEDERHALRKAFAGQTQRIDSPGGYGEIFGSQPWEKREANTIDFSQGRLKILATKPSLNGVGCNFQKFCHRAIALGIDHDFELFYQAMIKRIHRFGQRHPFVRLDIITAAGEEPVRQNLERKWREHTERRRITSEHVRKYGLSQEAEITARRRSFHSNRQEWTGEHYRLINGDCVAETRQMPANSVGMVLSSFPFGNHYEYSDKYEDFGHNVSDDAFLEQLDFLLPELLRILKPGRIAAIHLKNRIHYGSVTGRGFSTFHRFTHMVCDRMERHGFHCIGFHYVDTDVVRENNQTYRLGHTEMCKDSTKMGAGIPEEIWLFRKAPSSNAKAYADEPVQHSKADYTVAQWQLDAAAHWRSSGNRALTPAELQAMTPKQIVAWWKDYNRTTQYDYEQHVDLCKALQAIDKLPRTFALLPVQSTTGAIWDDVNAMHCLNAEQSRRNLQNHICPMPYDEVDRLIEMYSNPGDIVFDPFGGVGSTGVRAVMKGRIGWLTELNDTYALCAKMYLEEAERGRMMPSLLDLMAIENGTSVPGAASA